ncbi:FapA family protein [Heliobacterium mobile]|nr:FapA family protein [Heliobacterium mobile]
MSSKEPEKDVTINVDGQVWIDQTGLVRVQNPNGVGRYPVVSPGQHVTVYVDGEEIREPVVVSEESKVRIVPEEVPALSEIEVILSSDELVAEVVTRFGPKTEYKAAPTEPAVQVVVEGEIDREVPPGDISEGEVVQALQRAGVTAETNLQEVLLALQEKRCGRFVVARGQAALNGEDEIFRLVEPKQREVGEQDLVNYREKSVYGVEIGRLVAIRAGDVRGKPGLTVRGKVISAKDGKGLAIKVGHGVAVKGRQYVATTSGRPRWDPVRRVLEVLPVFECKSVDLTTGNIHFPGDVSIKGDVQEGFIVEATGTITVDGSVYGGHLMAGSHIIVSKNVIGGTVEAGGIQASLKSVLLYLSPLVKRMQDCLQAIEQLKRNPAFRFKDLAQTGDGPLFALLMENKYRDVPGYVEKVIQVGTEVIPELVKELKEMLLGPSITKVNSLDEVAALVDEMARKEQDIQESVARTAEVTVGNVQNSQIVGSGSVTVNGSAINSEVRSGSNISVRGVFRGGTASGFSIICGELGSPGDVETEAVVGEKGTISAKVLHSGVILRLGTVISKTVKLELQVKCRTEDGRLVVERGRF